jgi:hypothetical protein
MPRASLLVALALAPVIIAVATVRTGAAQDEAESPLAALGLPEVAVSVTDEGFTTPAEVAAGRVLVTLENETEYTVDAAFIRLPDGVKRSEVEGVFQSAAVLPPEWFYEMVAAGGPVARPGEVGRAVIDLGPGAWAVVQTDPTIPIGSAGVVVTGEAPPAETEPVPAADLTVRTGEYGFSFPPEIEAGRQVWKVINAGTMPHVVALSSYPEAVTADQVAAALSQPAAATPVPAGIDPNRFGEGPFVTVQSAGVTSWVEVDVVPGSYVALCFVPDRDGTLHALKGMIDVLAAR